MTDYSVVERTRTITAAPETITPLLIDYRRWTEWSPWEHLDPNMQRTYSGPESGVGAHYAWSGNKAAGSGNMEVTAVERAAIDMDLNFLKPFKSASKVHFALVPEGDDTSVVWQIHSPKTLMTRIFGLFINFDKRVGTDLEQGLANLQRVVGAGT